MQMSSQLSILTSLQKRAGALIGRSLCLPLTTPLLLYRNPGYGFAQRSLAACLLFEKRIHEANYMHIGFMYTQ